jgi:hypothetical protein
MINCHLCTLKKDLFNKSGTFFENLLARTIWGALVLLPSPRSATYFRLKESEKYLYETGVKARPHEKG